MNFKCWFLSDEKHDVFLNLDIFIFHKFYHNECFSLEILEGMQCAIHEVSSNEGGTRCYKK